MVSFLQVFVPELYVNFSAMLCPSHPQWYDISYTLWDTNNENEIYKIINTVQLLHIVTCIIDWYAPGVDSAPNSNEYQEFSWW
jgi:hypothetical protein